MRKISFFWLVILVGLILFVSGLNASSQVMGGLDCAIHIDGAGVVTGMCNEGPTTTPEPTETATPTSTPTAAPSPTAAPTSTHNVTLWHPPGDGHHHGGDITSSSFISLVMQFAGQEIAYPWVSSPIENIFPYPAGKHEGFKWLIEEDTECPVYGLDPSTTNCMAGYAMQVHTIGTAEAVRTRFHSFALVARVCGIGGSGPCGYVFTGGLVDYGVLHNPYKTEVCRLAADPANFDYTPGGVAFAPPYRTGHRTTERPPIFQFPIEAGGANTQLWSSLGPNNEIQALYYPEDPNYIVRAAWASLDAWEYTAGDVYQCAMPENDAAICPDGSCEYNHTLFKTQGIFLSNLPSQRPFNGFTDQWGHVDPDCTEAGPECVPLFISGNVPLGEIAFNRPFRASECNTLSPCLPDFDDGTPLIMPGYGGN